MRQDYGFAEKRAYGKGLHRGRLLQGQDDAVLIANLRKSISDDSAAITILKTTVAQSNIQKDYLLEELNKTRRGLQATATELHLLQKKQSTSEQSIIAKLLDWYNEGIVSRPISYTSGQRENEVKAFMQRLGNHQASLSRELQAAKQVILTKVAKW